MGMFLVGCSQRPTSFALTSAAGLTSMAIGP